MKKLTGDDYANLVTVFAVILAVEYSPDAYDIWDVLIGLLAIFVGLKFIPSAKRYRDSLYSLFTAALIGLGIVSLLGFVTFIAFGLPDPTVDATKRFLEELGRFGVFFVITALIYLPIQKKSPKHKNKQLIREGSYVAEVDVEFIGGPNAWFSSISPADVEKVDEVRAALQNGDLQTAATKSRVFSLTPIDLQLES